MVMLDPAPPATDARRWPPRAPRQPRHLLLLDDAGDVLGTLQPEHTGQLGAAEHRAAAACIRGYVTQIQAEAQALPEFAPHPRNPGRRSRPARAARAYGEALLQLAAEHDAAAAALTREAGR